MEKIVLECRYGFRKKVFIEDILPEISYPIKKQKPKPVKPMPNSQTLTTYRGYGIFDLTGEKFDGLPIYKERV